MSEARCSTKVDLPLKKRAMKKQFSPPAVRLRGEVCDLSEEQEARARGLAVNARLLEAEDSEAFENIMQKQLEIVEGSEQFYGRIDLSLREGRIEPFFVKEQWDLFSWREKFFNDNFPPGEEF